MQIISMDNNTGEIREALEMSVVSCFSFCTSKYNLRRYFYYEFTIIQNTTVPLKSSRFFPFLRYLT